MDAAHSDEPDVDAVSRHATDGDPERRDHERRMGLVSRPLGQAPLLDSDPLPATRPGMLRPRTPEEPTAGDGFSLPVQRPAFDLGSGEPADVN